MTDYKQAGDLVPDDLYIRRRRLYYRGPREQIYRVITTRPGSPATIVEVIASGVPREPQKGEEPAAL